MVQDYTWKHQCASHFAGTRTHTNLYTMGSLETQISLLWISLECGKHGEILQTLLTQTQRQNLTVDAKFKQIISVKINQFPDKGLQLCNASVRSSNVVDNKDR